MGVVNRGRKVTITRQAIGDSGNGRQRESDRDEGKHEKGNTR